MKEWRSALISSGLSIVLALGSSMLGWSYKAGQYETRMDQMQSEQVQTKEMIKQMSEMNKNLVIIQTEMKYYRRDIDDLRKKQDEISTRMDNFGPMSNH